MEPTASTGGASNRSLCRDTRRIGIMSASPPHANSSDAGSLKNSGVSPSSRVRKQVRDYLRLTFGGAEEERFVVLFLDSQNRLIAVEEISRGTLCQTSVYPREVVKRALHWNAAATIFAHNHPSGVAEPSRADEMLTVALKQSLALVDVKVLDHFIVGGSTVMSFAERGLI